MTDLLAEAKSFSFKLLSYRGRSEKEIAERLHKKGFHETVVQDAVSYLIEKGFLNDSALAETLKKEAEEVKLFGTSGTKSYLRHRGIPVEIIARLFKDGNSNELDAATKFVKKKLKGSVTTENISLKKTRLFGMLLRRGFSSETIKETLKKFEEAIDDEES